MNRSLDAVAFMNYVKYDRLVELINYAYAGSNATQINIYIDLYPIIRSIYADTYQVNYNGYMDLVPLVINICAHYRYFFRKFYKVESIIYLIAGKNRPDMSVQVIPEYNYTMKKREQGPIHIRMDEMVSSNLQILEILCPYLPNIHFINTEYETSVAMANIIDIQPDKSIPNLVISKDLYPIQLVTLFPNTTFIRPTKNSIAMGESEDVSVIIKPTLDEESCKEFWKYICIHHKLKIDPGLIKIHPINFSTTAAFTGFTERSIKLVMHLNTISNMIYKEISNNPSQCSIDTLFNDFNLDSKMSRQVIANRFHVMDIPYQLAYYKVSKEAILLRFENKVDPITVKAICDKYFQNIPINLERL